MKSIGAKLKELREDSDYPQKAIAELLGIQRSNYSRIENGHQNLNQTQIKLLCEFLNVSADYLLGIKISDKRVISRKDEKDIHKSLKEIQDIISK
ncbi:MAG: helix-turn-helix transcriptional regulator [Candidatus Izemoplasma sp.]